MVAEVGGLTAARHVVRLVGRADVYSLFIEFACLSYVFARHHLLIAFGCQEILRRELVCGDVRCCMGAVLREMPLETLPTQTSFLLELFLMEGRRTFEH